MNEQPADDDLVEVRLAGLPLLLRQAAREHHAGLMREFRLMALDEGGALDTVPARLVVLVEALGTRYAAVRERDEVAMDHAWREGRTHVDHVLHVPRAAGAAAAQLRVLLEEADEYCRQAMLLTLPRSSEVHRYATWYLGEFERQCAGLPPRAWHEVGARV